MCLQATWRHGYWVRDMNQECYSGVHAAAYLPLGIVAVIIFCVIPPIATAAIMWRRRHSLAEYHTMQLYGFLYRRYKWVMFCWVNDRQPNGESAGAILSERLMKF